MDEKEIEEKLQKSAKKEEMRDFSEVWENIQDRVTPSRAKKRKKLRWIPALVSSVAAVALISAISIPIILNNLEDNEVIYYYDELTPQEVQKTEFFSRINSSELSCINFEKYDASYYAILKTEKNIVKGGMIEFTDNKDLPTISVKIDFYDSSVNLDNLGGTMEDYDCLYVSKNGAQVEYKLTESTPEYSLYVYDIKASYNSVNYYINLTCFTEEIKPFLDCFFE